MKNILFTIIILFASTIIHGQDLEYLKKLDTIYIKFNSRKNQKKYDIQTRITPSNFDEKIFQLNLKNFAPLNFEHAKYKSWEKKNANVASEVKEVNKSFIRKNNDKIITTKLLDKYDYYRIVCEILSQMKTFYIIDYTEKKNKKHIAYEVVLINSCPVYE